MYGLGRWICANQASESIWTGTPYRPMICGLAYIEGPLLFFQTLRWFSYFSSRIRVLFSDNVDPKMYTIWNPMQKIVSASGAPPQTQVRGSRRSPYFLPSCNRNFGSFALAVPRLDV